MRATEIVSLTEEVVSELANTGSFLSGNVRVGCVESKALEEVANLIEIICKAQYPHVIVELRAADGDELRSSLIVIF